MTKPAEPNPKQNILITGFGPFPGMARNVSGELTADLRQAAQVRLTRHTPNTEFQFHHATLKTEWHAGPTRLRALLADLNPILVLHFGVSAQAEGFVLETRGENICRHTIDAIGQTPISPHLCPDSPDAFDATLPTAAILTALQGLNLPAAASNDAGAYLCNAVLFETLKAFANTTPPSPRRCAGFIHLPPNPDDHLGPTGFISGGLAILEISLNALQNRQNS